MVTFGPQQKHHLQVSKNDLATFMQPLEKFGVVLIFTSDRTDWSKNYKLVLDAFSDPSFCPFKSALNSRGAKAKS